MTKGSVIAALTAVAIFGLVAQTAFAQYPTPQNNLVCAVSQVNAEAGNTVFAATLHNGSGAAVPGQPVAFSVVSGDATLSSASAVTDANGTAAVNVVMGANAGNVVLRASNGAIECRATAAVSEVESIRPPSTGDAGLADGHGGSAPITALAIAFGGLLSMALVTRRPGGKEL